MSIWLAWPGPLLVMSTVAKGLGMGGAKGLWTAPPPPPRGASAAEKGGGSWLWGSQQGPWSKLAPSSSASLWSLVLLIYRSPNSHLRETFWFWHSGQPLRMVALSSCSEDQLWFYRHTCSPVSPWFGAGWGWVRGGVFYHSQNWPLKTNILDGETTNCLWWWWWLQSIGIPAQMPKVTHVEES